MTKQVEQWGGDVSAVYQSAIAVIMPHNKKPQPSSENSTIGSYSESGRLAGNEQTEPGPAGFSSRAATQASHLWTNGYLDLACPVVMAGDQGAMEPQSLPRPMPGSGKLSLLPTLHWPKPALLSRSVSRSWICSALSWRGSEATGGKVGSEREEGLGAALQEAGVGVEAHWASTLDGCLGPASLSSSYPTWTCSRRASYAVRERKSSQEGQQ